MINLSKLQKVVHKDGKIEAQCPACHASGADTTGNHVVIYPDGKYGCAANPGDKAHNKEIFKLAGEMGAPASPQVTVRRQIIPESKVLMKIGRIGQKKSTPVATGEGPKEPKRDAGEAKEVGPACPPAVEVEDFPPAPAPGWKTLESVTNEQAREFLYGAAAGSEVAA